MLYGVVISLSFLVAKFLFQRHPEIQVEQLLLLRSSIGILIVILTVNKDLPKALWTQIPKGQFKNVFLRCFQDIGINFIEFQVVKNISLVFQGIARNLTPIATVVLAYFMTKERFSRVDIFFIIVSLIGVILLNIGTGMQNKGDASTSADGADNGRTQTFVLVLGFVASLCIPFLSGWGNIVMRSMKGLHRSTITCFIQISMGIFTAILIAIKGEFGTTRELILSFDSLDWTLVVLLAVGTVSNQTLRYLAL